MEYLERNEMKQKRNEMESKVHRNNKIRLKFRIDSWPVKCEWPAE